MVRPQPRKRLWPWTAGVLLILAAGLFILENTSLKPSIKLSYPITRFFRDHVIPQPMQTQRTSPREPERLTHEIPVCEDVKVENWYNRYCTVVNFSVTAKARTNRNEQLAERVKANNVQIKDEVRSIVAGVHPEDLRDPELKRIKTEVRQSLKEIVGPEMVEDILIPKWKTDRR